MTMPTSLAGAALYAFLSIGGHASIRQSTDFAQQAVTADFETQLSAATDLFEAEEFERALDAYQRVLDLVVPERDRALFAEAENGVGACLLALGRLEEALPLLSDALEIRRALDEPLERAISASNVGMCLGDLGRMEEACDAFAEAKELLFGVGDDGRAYLVFVFENYLVTLNDLELYEEALALCEERLLVARDASDAPSEELANALIALGVGLENVDGLEEALVPLHEALRLCESAFPDTPAHGNALHQMASVMTGLDRAEEALPLVRRSVEMMRNGVPTAPIEAVQKLDVLAHCCRSLGRYPDAIVAYRELLGLVASEFPDDREFVATTEQRLAACLEEVGRCEEALEYAQRALSARREGAILFQNDLATNLDTVASCLHACRRFEEALPFREEAITEMRLVEGPESENVATLVNNTGWTLQALGRTREALACYEEALASWRRLGARDDVNLVGVYKNIAVCQADLGNFEAAHAAFEKSLAMARTLDSAPIHRVLSAYGTALCDEGRASEALPLLEEAMDRIEGLRGLAMGLEESDRSHYYASLKGNAYDRLVETYAELGRTELALHAAERGRGRGLLDLLERSGIDFLEEAEKGARLGADDAALERLEEVRQGLDRAAEAVAHASVFEEEAHETRSSRAERAEAVKRAQAELMAARGDYEAAQRHAMELAREQVPASRPREPVHVQNLLAVSECALVYAIGDRKSYVFELAPGAEPKSFALSWEDGRAVNARELGAWVERYTAFLDSSRSSPSSKDIEGSDPEGLPTPPSSFAALGHGLFRALVPPTLWEGLARRSVVIVVPHGALHVLPLEALIVETGADRAQHAYWLDRGPAVAYAPSLSVFAWCRERTIARGSPRTELDVLALGDPVFSRGEKLASVLEAGSHSATDARSDASFESITREADALFGRPRSLPATRREVEAIREAWLEEGRSDGSGDDDARVELLLGERATRDALWKRAPEARIVHLATHCISYETRAASFSALLLTARQDARTRDTGRLELRELLSDWRGRLSACELVVLSACRTQRGASERDEAVLAMPTGFLYAGASAVVATLWSVDDARTADLMEDFYGRLFAAESVLPQIAALNEARKDLRRDHPDPTLWAPFVWIGDAR